MRRRVGGWVDSESVRVYQAVIFVGYLVSAVQTLALGSPPTAVNQTMGGAVSAMWIGLLIGCPILSAVGYWYRHKPGGLWLLIAGDAGAACATAAYVCAVLQTTWAQRATFAGWMAASLTVCAVLILIRDVRRLRAQYRAVNEVEHE